MILFLDFDGVLHHKDAAGRELRPRDQTTLDSLSDAERRYIDKEGRLIVGANLFCHAERLVIALQPFPDVRIVISSSWRKYFDIDSLKVFLPATLADRVIGVTPVVFPCDGTCLRSREIYRYFSEHNLHTNWLALDDTSYHFFDYDKNPNLILLNGECGFDNAAADILCARLNDVFTESQKLTTTPPPS